MNAAAFHHGLLGPPPAQAGRAPHFACLRMARSRSGVYTLMGTGALNPAITENGPAASPGERGR